MKSVEQYAEEYAKLSDDDLITEFGTAYWAADRCVGSGENQDSANSLAAGRAELLQRMRLKLPEHKCGLHLEHNAHKNVYESISDFLGDHLKDMSPDDLAECQRTDSLWTLQWYPKTPTGFIFVAGPTLERVLQLANE